MNQTENGSLSKQRHTGMSKPLVCKVVCKQYNIDIQHLSCVNIVILGTYIDYVLMNATWKSELTKVIPYNTYTSRNASKVSAFHITTKTHGVGLLSCGVI